MSDTTSVLSTPGAAFDDLDQELASTRRILERFPDDKGEWGPHDKSRTIGQLAAHVANLPGLAAMILQTDHIDVMKRQPTPPAKTAAELVAFFDGNVAMLKKAIENAGPDDLGKSWSLKAGDRALITQTKRALLRVMFLSHMIHHRAQLGVYYRLLGVPVPGVYGPTADEPI
jgi:uncharacterized damage-inducible protein DinB